MRALRTAGSAGRQGGDAALPREGRPRAPVAVPSQGRSADLALLAFFEEVLASEILGGLLASEIRKGPSAKLSHLKQGGARKKGAKVDSFHLEAGSCGSVSRRREVGRVA